MTEKATKMVLIEYIGVCVNRPDDVLRTPRIWKKKGDVIAVLESEAPHYLRHPGEWQAITPTEAETRQQARAMVSASLERMKAEWEPMTVDDLMEVRDEIDARIAVVKVEGVKKVAAAKPAEPAPIDAAEGLESGNADSMAAAGDRIKEIAKIIRDMDDKDEDQYSSQGPRKSVVSELYGAPVSMAEIKLAVAFLEGAEK